MKSKALIRYKTRGETALVELRLSQTRQIFDNRDPSPFISRDLDPDAVEYMVGAVSELKIHQKFSIEIYATAEEPDSLPESEVRNAIHSFFQYQVQLTQGKIQLIFRRARISLVLGLLLMFGCLALANFIEGWLPAELPVKVFAEGISILGWVAMWKPLELLLYEWWPLMDFRSIYSRLSKCEIHLHLKKSAKVD